MKYTFSYSKPSSRFMNIEFFAAVAHPTTQLQLPAWRPGRYELGNFAKNIQRFSVVDQDGKKRTAQKITKDLWEVDTAGASTISVKYNYYAAELNAGSSYIDDEQLYVNPVNCCLYIPGKEQESCELLLNLPDRFQVAIGKKPADGNDAFARKFQFDSFHQLVDSPFICSAALQHKSFTTQGIRFHWWFQGECKPDWERLERDFLTFCGHTLECFEKAPFDDYHFLFQILPTRFYHGVEHVNSTVIALGPGTNLMKPELYESLLGVSCHELYHAWNIKTIRPVEMFPYDYTRENYSRLGYVCEGVTTYFGDYLLLRSGVFTIEQYGTTFTERFQKHKDNFGRFNMSVRDSSFDTWLDGYVPGIPNRKTSIYDEGCLLALVTDVFIRKNSKNKYSLDDVMKRLYHDFALKNKGYTEEEYIGLIEKFAGASFRDLFEANFVKAQDLTTVVDEALYYIGCQMLERNSVKVYEHALGLKFVDQNNSLRVTAIYPDSVADLAGISIGDEMIAINGKLIKPDGSGYNLLEWANYLLQENSPVQLTLGRNGRELQFDLTAKPGSYYKLVQFQKRSDASPAQKSNFENWAGISF